MSTTQSATVDTRVYMYIANAILTICTPDPIFTWGLFRSRPLAFRVEPVWRGASEHPSASETPFGAPRQKKKKNETRADEKEVLWWSQQPTTVKIYTPEYISQIVGAYFVV